MRRRAFTLVELLLAVAISAILLSAVLTVTAGLARDRRALAQRQTWHAMPGSLVELLQWDLANARTMANASDGHLLVLVGHGGIDPFSLRPHSRLTRVIYRISRPHGVSALVREQQYLDDPLRPMPWREVAAVGVTGVFATSTGPGASAVNPRPIDETRGEAASGQPAATVARMPAVPVPNRVRLRVDMGKVYFSRELVIR